MRVSHTYLGVTGPLAIAHRGGAATGDNVGIENTMTAFADAVARGYRYLETDVRCSADGTVHVVHDETLQRVAGDPRRIAELSDADLSGVRIGGREPIPLLTELYETFPDARLNIDVKSWDAIEPTCALVEAMGAVDRTCLASFEHRTLAAIRRRLPRISTGASRREVTRAKLRTPSRGPRTSCLQVPVRHSGVTVVTPGFVRRAHTLGIPVHVWTIDDATEMHRLLDLGVDGIMTDRTDVLADVFAERGLSLEGTS